MTIDNSQHETRVRARPNWILVSLVSWVALIATALVEGVFRVSVLESVLPEFIAEVLGILIVLATAVIIAGFCVNRDLFPLDWRLWAIDLMWMILTVASEFVIFGWIVGMSLQQLLENNDIASGNLFPVGLLALLFVPPSVAAMVNRRQQQGQESR